MDEGAVRRQLLFCGFVQEEGGGSAAEASLRRSDVVASKSPRGILSGAARNFPLSLTERYCKIPENVLYFKHKLIFKENRYELPT